MAPTVDLRSDTVTQPTFAMREAMATAAVGDDGYGEDPTINELESRVAERCGADAALFLPSGVMANQVALRVLARPGDLVVAGAHQHVVSFEMGAAAQNAGVQFVTIDDDRGVLAPSSVAEVIDREADHQPHVGLIAIENTHMYSGGVPWSPEEIDAVADVADGRPLFLDGARLFHAAVATGRPLADFTRRADLTSLALSKGLAAPVGSLLVGSSERVARARVERKRLGGAMRQAGVLAAAGLVAIDQMVERLADDHRRARRLADAVARAFPESNYDPATCRTNIVAFDHPRAREVVARLAALGVEGGTLSPGRVRFVTHVGVDDDDLDRAVEVISSFTW